MFTATNLLVRAMNYNLVRGIRAQKRKIFSKSSKRRYYFSDSQYYRKEYLKSQHWKDLRQQKLEHNPICEKCGSKENLEPHHLHYKNLYDVKITDLQTLCRKCHNKVHVRRKQKALIKRRHERLLNQRKAIKLANKPKKLKQFRGYMTVREYKFVCNIEKQRIRADQFRGSGEIVSQDIANVQATGQNRLTAPI